MKSCEQERVFMYSAHVLVFLHVHILSSLNRKAELLKNKLKFH